MAVMMMMRMMAHDLHGTNLSFKGRGVVGHIGAAASDGLENPDARERAARRQRVAAHALGLFVVLVEVAPQRRTRLVPIVRHLCGDGVDESIATDITKPSQQQQRERVREER